MQSHVENSRICFNPCLDYLGLLFRLERRILALIVSYSLAIGLFSLSCPLTVQELDQYLRLCHSARHHRHPGRRDDRRPPVCRSLPLTCSIMPWRCWNGGFLRASPSAMAQQIPHLRFLGFKPRYANHFMETVFMQRALSVLLVDLINVVVGGAVGMTILVFYHPYFLLYNALLLAGFSIVFLLSHGGLKATIDMSHAKYDTLHWMQEISYNLLHLKRRTVRPS